MGWGGGGGGRGDERRQMLGKLEINVYFQHYKPSSNYDHKARHGYCIHTLNSNSNQPIIGVGSAHL